MAVLLIGSTGNGRSSLGNFLLDPDDVIFGGKFFTVATDNQPQTQSSELVKGRVKFNSTTKDLIVIDTPGLNESKVKDLEHMTNLIEALHQEKAVRACIFVMKFSTKIDQQYKDSIKYYSKLLPSLFANDSIIIVMTDYATDMRSELLRQQLGIKCDTIRDNVEKQAVASSGIDFMPKIFAINSLPLEDDELARSKSVRADILSLIFSQKEVRVINLDVAKTKALMDEDEKIIKGYEGENLGYMKRLEEYNKDSKKVLDEVLQNEQHITTIERDIIQIEESLKEKALVTAALWTVDDSFKLFQSQSKECIDGGGSRKVHGSNKFKRDLYATITLERGKKLKFATEIEELNIKLKKTKAECEESKKVVKVVKVEHERFLAIIKKLKEFIEEKRELIKEHSSTMMTLEQARLRLKKYET